MAEVISEAPQSIEDKTEHMEASSGPETLASKRGREEEEENQDEISKKPKVDDESTKDSEVEMKGKEEEKPSSAKLGPKEFGSGEDMFDFFFKFLHYWPPNLDVNKYEHLFLLELLKKGHTESDKKIGGGIQAFQVRYHPMWKSRCFFLVRIDGSSDDFSFRKCVDHILPLPENMKIHSSSDGNKKFGGQNKGGGRGGGRGGRGGRGRGGFRK